MIEEQGKVVEIDATGVWVETVRQSACASCAARNGCGQKLLASAGQGKRFIFRVNNPDNILVHENDDVLLGIEEGAFLRATLFMYLIPLLALFVGAVIGNYLFVNEIATIIFSFLALTLSFVFVRYGSQPLFRSYRYQPVLMKVI